MSTVLADPPITDTGEVATPSASATPTPGHRPHRRVLIGVIALAAAFFVSVCAFTAAALHTSFADRAAAAARHDAARSAAAAITTLWTYSPSTIETLPDRARQYLGGDFYEQYRQFLESAIAPTKRRTSPTPPRSSEPRSNR